MYPIGPLKPLSYVSQKIRVPISKKAAVARPNDGTYLKVPVERELPNREEVWWPASPLGQRHGGHAGGLEAARVFACTTYIVSI